MTPVHWLIPGPAHAALALLLAWLLARRFRARLPRGVPGLIALLLAWTWITATPALGNLLVRQLEARHPAVDVERLVPDAAGRIVVLASGQMFRPDGRVAHVLDDDGWERLRAGIALWRRVGGQLVLVGGPGSGASDSFAQLMQREALAAGVPANAIRPVGGSRSTVEDLRVASRALQPDGSRTWLVTSALHMPRAAATARGLGLDWQPFPCGWRQLEKPSWRAWLPDSGDPSLWRDGLHEAIGLIVYRIRGWIGPMPA